MCEALGHICYSVIGFLFFGGEYAMSWGYWFLKFSDNIVASS